MTFGGGDTCRSRHGYGGGNENSIMCAATSGDRNDLRCGQRGVLDLSFIPFSLPSNDCHCRRCRAEHQSMCILHHEPVYRTCPHGPVAHDADNDGDDDDQRRDHARCSFPPPWLPGRQLGDTSATTSVMMRYQTASHNRKTHDYYEIRRRLSPAKLRAAKYLVHDT